MCIRDRFSLTDFSPVYVSANIEQEGYTQEEFSNLTANDLFKGFHGKQLSIGIKNLQWFNRFKKVVPNFGRGEDELIIFGVKLKGKRQKLKTFLFKCKGISLNKESGCGYAFFEVEEIGSLYKSDTWWTKYNAVRNNRNITRYYFSNGQKKESVDLFSPRELEILKLIIEHKNSVEISQLLNISTETVKKHRKNMIAKVGAKDMSALIYICLQANVI